MTIKSLCLALALTFAATGAAARDTPSWKLGFDGIGPFRIGASFEDVNRSAGRSLRHAYNPDKRDPRCEYLPSRRYPGIAFLFVDARLTRIDISSPAWPTGADLAVAGAAAQVPAMHPDARQQKLKNGALAFTVNAPGGARAVRYITDGTRINALSAGETASVEEEQSCG